MKLRTSSIFIYSAVVFFVLVVALPACKKEEPPVPPFAATPLYPDLPPGWPPLVSPADNPLTEEGVALGRRLYYDDILSTNGMSCSVCHQQAKGFSNPGLGPTGRAIMPHINVGWKSNFGWTGAESLLDHVPLADLEPGNVFLEANPDSIKERMKRHPLYPTMFRQAFNVEIADLPVETRNQYIARALAQFIRTQISGSSRYDKFKRGEPGGEFTQSEFNGYAIFFTEKGDCFHCHTLPFFRDDGYHNVGLDSVFTGINEGRFEVTGEPTDKGKFATPTLRNIALTAPYMHDNRFSTLAEVVEHYNSGVKNSPQLDPILNKPSFANGLNLTMQEKADLVAFLETLTDTSFIHNPSLDSPF